MFTSLTGEALTPKLQAFPVPGLPGGPIAATLEGEAMKPHLPALALLPLAVLLVNTGVRAEILHTLKPHPVTENEALGIRLTVPRAHLDGCHFTTFQQERIGNQITIDLTTDTEGEICSQEVGDAVAEVPVGPLPAGTYTVTITHRYANRTDRPEQEQFTLDVLPAPPQPRLTGSSELSFDTVPGRTYQVVCSSALGSWDPLGDPIVGDGNPARIPLPGGGGSKFFRVVVTAGS